MAVDFFLPRLSILRVFAVLLVGLMAACTQSIQPETMPLGQHSFAAYRQDSLNWLQRYRQFQTDTPQDELLWNAPTEWQPAQPAHRGILLVHGLGDSPWSFQDLGPLLQKQGFLVRTLLLPGHGTRPEELMQVRLEDWQQVVQEQVSLLRREVKEVYLGGFSTGANLVLDYAYAHPDVSGLLLFSPGFRAATAYDWLAPWLVGIRPWLLDPKGRPMQNAVRYQTVPTNGFAQFYRSSRLARERLDSGPYPHPVLMVVAAQDSVLDTPYLLQQFQSRFVHPDSRLLWYGSLPPEVQEDSRILVRPDYLPERHISQFSHMGPLFSPANPLYGEQGRVRICWNGQEAEATQACQQGAPVWFSDWGYREAGRIHARLTYNPYFDWQAEVLKQVLH